MPPKKKPTIKVLKFSEYEKMENSIDKFVVTDAVADAEWVATEKIHGANFSFHVCEAGIKVASRRKFMSGNESFFNYQNAEFMKTYSEKMNGVYNSVVEKLPAEPKVFQVSIWGELLGGTYVVNGEELAEGKMDPVQKEISYCPQIEWVAYDISYRTKGDVYAQEFIDYDVAVEIFSEHNIFYLKPLYQGPMEGALDYALEFDSTLPKILGQPDLPAGSNTAEGIVVKPLKNIKAIDNSKKQSRVILKIKHPSFDESREPANNKMKRRGLIEDNVSEVPKTPTTPTTDANSPAFPASPELPDLNTLKAQVLEYCTEKRLTSAITKFGNPVGPEVVKEVTEELVKSVWADFKDDISEEIKKISEDHKFMTELRRAIRSEATKQVKDKEKITSDSNSEDNILSEDNAYGSTSASESADGMPSRR